MEILFIFSLQFFFISCHFGTYNSIGRQIQSRRAHTAARPLTTHSHKDTDRFLRLGIVVVMFKFGRAVYNFGLWSFFCSFMALLLVVFMATMLCSMGDTRRSGPATDDARKWRIHLIVERVQACASRSVHILNYVSATIRCPSIVLVPADSTARANIKNKSCHEIECDNRNDLSVG